MGRKRDMVRRCAQVRNLLQENKYTTALELIDSMPLGEVGSVEDLYLYADLYEKAERMDKKKEIYYLIYDRTHSRRVLERLLRLVLRMGEMKEARELFLTYEFAGEVTLDTFELRYLIAKAEGEPRRVLIQILEELKREEYTEEWGYQLARLYEQEGMREECIRECKDLQLWFGEGRIVEKAKELQRQCESPDWEPPREDEIPEPEEPDYEETITYAAPPVEVKDMDQEMEQPLEEADSEESSENPRDIKADTKVEKKPEVLVDAEVEGEPEVLVDAEVEREPEVLADAEVEREPEALVDAEVEGESEVSSVKEAEEESSGSMEKPVVGESGETFYDGIESGVDQLKDFVAAMKSKWVSVSKLKKRQEQEPEQLEVPEKVRESEHRYELEKQMEIKQQETKQREIEQQLKPEPVSMPVDEKAKNIVENLDDLLKDEPEDISPMGNRYFTLKSTIEQVRRSRRSPHFAFAGGEESITRALAKKIAKELNNVGYFSAKSIVKITADKLNELNLEDQIEKVAGACMLITDAPNLSSKTVGDIVAMISDNSKQVVVMLSGPFDELDCFFADNSELADHIYYKVRM